eukprot:1180671-Rhodomonas_salina.1
MDFFWPWSRIRCLLKESAHCGRDRAEDRVHDFDLRELFYLLVEFLISADAHFVPNIMFAGKFRKLRETVFAMQF